MTADEKMNNLGLVNRGSKKFPDYGHKDDDKYTEVEFHIPHYVTPGGGNKRIKEVTIYFYPEEGIDFDNFMNAIKSKLEEYEVAEMTAKEMFRKLGYKKISMEFMGDELRKIKCENISNKDRIEFYTENQHFIEINGNGIYVEELQAINQQCKELRWLHE